MPIERVNNGPLHIGVSFFLSLSLCLSFFFFFLVHLEPLGNEVGNVQTVEDRDDHGINSVRINCVCNFSSQHHCESMQLCHLVLHNRFLDYGFSVEICSKYKEVCLSSSLSNKVHL